MIRAVPGSSEKMEIEEIKTEPVDFVREFQEYLTQQTHHVNMISGSVCGAKEPGEPFQAGQNAAPPGAFVTYFKRVEQ